MIESENFEINIGETKAVVSEHFIGENRIFRIAFNDSTAPLAITIAKTVNGKNWMSIPQGRQKEAEKIGSIIEEHFRKK